MALEALPHDNTLHLGVSRKGHPHEIINLSLLEVRPPPQTDHRGHYGILTAISSGLEKQAMIVLEGFQNVDYLEVVRVIDSSEGIEVVEIELWSVLEKLGY